MTNPFARLRLDGRVIVVTGGAGGIGRTTAELVAARGAAVVVADLDGAGGEAVAHRIGEQGGRAVAQRTDTTDEASVERLVRFAVSHFGGLHGAFNNAGIDNGHVPAADLALADWQRNVDVNMGGAFLCLKHELAWMAANGGGAIVNTSSAVGAVGCANATAYIAAKHGVVGLTRSAAVDYGPKGVRVNAVLPGAVRTAMLEGALEDPVVADFVARGHILGRVGEAHEIAEAVAWLLSDAASFVTGASILVDGGFTTW